MGLYAFEPASRASEGLKSLQNFTKKTKLKPKI